MASTLNVNRIGSKVSTLTIGEAGGDTVLDGNTLRADILKDSGGNVIFQSDGAGTVSNVNSGFGSSMVLILSQPFTDETTVSFTSGITSTYGEYIFKFYNIGPATDQVNFTFQTSMDGGSNYNLTVTNTYFRASHTEADATNLTYDTGADDAQGTAFMSLAEGLGNDADENTAGELHLFNPSSTSYVKHYIGKFSSGEFSPGAYNTFSAGYFNTTSDIDAIQFKMSSGNFDGTIKMFGIK